MSDECTNMPGKCPDNRCHWTCRPAPPTQTQVMFWGGPEDGVDRMIGMEAIRNSIPILVYERLTNVDFDEAPALLAGFPLVHTYNPWRLALDECVMRHADTPPVITVLVHSSWGMTEIDERLQAEMTPYVDGST